MRILEILLSRAAIKSNDPASNPQQRIDFLRQRMDSYVDKICDPKTTTAGKEFLKSKLRDDYYELKGLMPSLHLVAEKSKIKESINRVPLTDEDFKAFEALFEKPIPAAVSLVYIDDVINDDELTAELQILENTQPNRDIRPLLADWFRRVMPDQLYRITGDTPGMIQREGKLSPIHGYSSGYFKAQHNNTSGNAYGRF